MSDIVDFITARLDEDERIAQTAGTGQCARWAYEPYNPNTSDPGAQYAGGEVFMPDTIRVIRSFPGRPSWHEVIRVTSDSEGLCPAVEPEQGHHIARHDPARVLRQVAALRRVVEAEIVNRIGFDGELCTCDAEQVRAGECDRWTPERSELLHALASAWSDHPDYQEEWTP